MVLVPISKEKHTREWTSGRLRIFLCLIRLHSQTTSFIWGMMILELYRRMLLLKGDMEIWFQVMAIQRFNRKTAIYLQQEHQSNRLLILTIPRQQEGQVQLNRPVRSLILTVISLGIHYWKFHSVPIHSRARFKLAILISIPSPILMNRHLVRLADQ